MDEVVVLSIPQIIVTFVAAMGIPSALTSYMLSRHEKRLEKCDEQREKERAKKEKDNGQSTSCYSWRQSMHLSPSEKPPQGLSSVFRMRNATVICTQPWSMLRK